MDLVGLRGVLDELHELVLVDHLPGGGGQVAAQLERRAVDLARAPAVVAHVLGHVRQPAQQRVARGLEHALERHRVRRQVVRGRQRIAEQRDRELGLLASGRVELAGLDQLDQQLRGGRPGAVPAHEPRVGLPREVGEPPIRRRRPRPADGRQPDLVDAGQQPRAPAPEGTGDLAGAAQRRCGRLAHRRPEEHRVGIGQQPGLGRQDLAHSAACLGRGMSPGLIPGPLPGALGVAGVCAVGGRHACVPVRFMIPSRHSA